MPAPCGRSPSFSRDRRYGGGALCVYLHGEPVVDIWTGYADRRGTEYWTADTGAMVFSVTKGLASTVIHRLADRGLIDYDTPVSEYWPEFGANGKADITVREVMRHRAGLSQLNGVSKADLLDHLAMEQRIAAAPVNRLLYGHQAYHALTYGWLMSGLGRAVTGKGMRELIRRGIGGAARHRRTPPGPASGGRSDARRADPRAPGHSGQSDLQLRRAAGGCPGVSGIFGSMYFPGMKAVVQGDTPFLDAEIPAANGVATARALAKMYGAIANGGRVNGTQLLSRERAEGLTGEPSYAPDRNIWVPLSFHLGYHSVPIPGVMPGFGHAGLAGSVGWADPESGMSFGFVHNRLLTRMVLDQATFAGLQTLIRRDAARARKHGYYTMPALGAPFRVTRSVAG